MKRTTIQDKNSVAQNTVDEKYSSNGFVIIIVDIFFSA